MSNQWYKMGGREGRGRGVYSGGFFNSTKMEDSLLSLGKSLNLRHAFLCRLSSCLWGEDYVR